MKGLMVTLCLVHIKCVSLSRGEGGHYSSRFLMRMHRTVREILLLFQTKNGIFYTPFHTWSLRNYVIITLIWMPRKIFLKLQFEFECYSVCLIHLRSKWQINTFIHLHSSLNNHAQFHTKMGKVYPCFHIEMVQKPYLWRWHIHVPLYAWLISYKRNYNLQAEFIPSIQTAPLKFHDLCSCSMSLVIKLEKISSSLKLSLRF